MKFEFNEAIFGQHFQDIFGGFQRKERPEDLQQAAIHAISKRGTPEFGLMFARLRQWFMPEEIDAYLDRLAAGEKPVAE